MNRKLIYGISFIAFVLLKIIGTLVMQVKPEIINTTITGVILGAGGVLFLWGLDERRRNENTCTQKLRSVAQDL